MFNYSLLVFCTVLAICRCGDRLIIEEIECKRVSTGIDAEAIAGVAALGAVIAAGATAIAGGAVVIGTGGVAAGTVPVTALAMVKAAAAGASGAATALKFLAAWTSGSDDLMVMVNGNKVLPISGQYQSIEAGDVLKLDISVDFDVGCEIQMVEYDSGSDHDDMGSIKVDPGIFDNVDYDGECSSGNQAHYRGEARKTKTGLTCQRWDSQAPHGHTRTPANYPDSGLEDNYCRNPDGATGAWCYTVDKGTRWGLCDVPECPGKNYRMDKVVVLSEAEGSSYYVTYRVERNVNADTAHSWAICGTGTCKACPNAWCTSTTNAGLDRDGDLEDLRACPYPMIHRQYRKYPQAWPFDDVYLRICSTQGAKEE